MLYYHYRHDYFIDFENCVEDAAVVLSVPRTRTFKVYNTLRNDSGYFFIYFTGERIVVITMAGQVP